MRQVLVLAVVAIAALWGALLLSGIAPAEALQGLLKGAFGSPAAFSGTLRETTPLLIAGIGVFFALRAGLFNIGIEGQFVVGALACAAVALRFPGLPGLALGVMAGIGAGALWALPAGLIRAYRGGHEVITTIMLNNIAGFLTTAIVAGPLKEAGQESATTADLAASTRVPTLLTAPVEVNASLFAGLALVVVVGVWMSRTVAGYELRATGANPVAAGFAGVPVARNLTKAMAVSGAIGGLAGALQVLAYEGRFYADFSPGYGFDALGVALLAGPSALGLVPGALLFGALSKGGTSIQILGVPKGITTVILGLILLMAAVARTRVGRRNG